MFRFRIWDREEGMYLNLEDRFAVLDHEGNAFWYDGDPVDPERYVIEPGNELFFHNDIVEAEVFGGSWNMLHPDWGEQVPRNCRNVHHSKGGFDFHMVYWDIPVVGVAVFQTENLNYHFIGLTDKDSFYYPDGPRFSCRTMKVVGNIRTDDFHMCPKYRDQYEFFNERNKKGKRK